MVVLDKVSACADSRAGNALCAGGGLEF